MAPCTEMELGVVISVPPPSWSKDFRLKMEGLIELMFDKVPDIHAAPRLWGGLTAVFCIAIFLIFIPLGQPQRGIVSMFVFGVVFLTFALFWEYRHRWWFWALLAVISLAHLLVIFSFDWAFEKRPGLFFALIGAVDATVIFAILSAAAKLSNRK